MDIYERNKIADAFNSKTFTPDEYIIREGEIGETFYILEKGKAYASKTFEPGMQILASF
jgi:cAMP-dependent protein kinase regulator